MALRLIGAGLGRTGTHSLKVALEILLGGPCYHMVEVFGRPDDVSVWHAAAKGEPVDWASLLDGYEAAVDWPASAFWPEIAAAFPDAVILLSTRRDADEWWASASRTIFEDLDVATPGMEAWHEMLMAMLANRFTPAFQDEAQAKTAYDRHNADARARADPNRLVEWTPADGWAPLCNALGVAIPAEPFPLTNTTAEFRERAGRTPL